VRHFGWEYFIRISKNEGIYPSSSRFDFDLRRTVIHDFFSSDWCVFFCVLLNPVQDLLFSILVEGDVLSSLSRIVQPMREGRLGTGVWAVECSGQCSHGDWDIIARFCNIPRECDLLASKQAVENPIPL
jgi:hypothetical protein